MRLNVGTFDIFYLTVFNKIDIFYLTVGEAKRKKEIEKEVGGQEE